MRELPSVPSCVEVRMTKGGVIFRLEVSTLFPPSRFVEYREGVCQFDQ